MIGALISNNNISIIIPVLNEEKYLKRLLPYLIYHAGGCEIIVVDGGSKDASFDIAKKYKVQRFQSDKASRAIQMNIGSRHACGNIFYFLNAVTFPPPTFVADIHQAFRAGKKMGCFRLKLELSQKLLRLNNFFSRFQTVFSGGGDQSLYVCAQAFRTSGGFNEAYCIMEDFEYVQRMQKVLDFHIIPKNVRASSRKYWNNSYFRVNLANAIAFGMFRAGRKPEKILSFYRAFLRPYAS